MTSTPTTTAERVVQVNRVYIKAPAQAVWDAITTPEWTTRYGYGGVADVDLRPGGHFRLLADDAMRAGGMPEVVVDGEVLEVDPPHRLVQTWRAGWDTEAATTLTYTISEGEKGVTCLTVTHDVTGAPRTAAMVAGSVDGAGGGWAQVVSDLKTLLETGTGLYAAG